MKKISFVWVGMAAAILVLSACSPKTAEPTAIPADTQPSFMVAEGQVLPAKSLDLSFSVPGQVAEVLVKDGESVKAGQVLARLEDSPEAQLALSRAQQESLAAQQTLDDLKASADLSLAQGQLAVFAAQEQNDTAQSRYDGNQSDENQAKLDEAAAKLKMAEDTLAKLKSGKGIHGDQLAAAEARLTSANAAVVSAQSAVDALELKASMDGTMVDINILAGQRVTPAQPVMTVADFSSWVVKTDNLTEVEVISIKEGQKVKINLDALPDVTLNGEVTHINTRFEEKRGDITYTVTVALKQTDERMRWGMTAAVQFVP